MLYQLHHYLDMIFLGLIPWWLYVVVAISAATILLFEVPTRMGLVLGLMVALVFCSLGFTAKGFQLGVTHEDDYWHHQAAIEHDRLESNFEALLDANNKRLADLKAQYDTLKQERDDVVNTAAVLPAGPVVIPAGIATRLYLIGRSNPKRRSPWFSPAGRSPSSPGVPLLLLQGGRPTGTG